MRFYLHRLLVVICGGSVISLVLLALPREHVSGPIFVDESVGSWPRPMRPRRRQFSVDSAVHHTPFAQAPIGDLKDETEYRQFERHIDADLLRRIDKYVAKLGNLKKIIADECTHNDTLADYWKRTRRRSVPIRDSWERFYAEIGSCDLYRNEETLNSLLSDLNTLPVKSVAIMEGGTQVKLIITLSNDKQAVFKPMRFGRDYESDPNHFYFSDFERHNAEIATFHLDKVLGFRRAVPTVGRVFNVSSELHDNAEKRLKKTFFISPAKNHCFVSKCDYYCDTTHAICGAPDMKEGSMQAFLPDEENVPRVHNRSPYRRTYSKRNQDAIWQKDHSYCEWKVKKKTGYAHGRRLLDLVDLHIIDYLIGNQDRHHFETIAIFDDYPAYPLHLDNGRAFGRTNFDDKDILLPLSQCCVIRPSTLLTLIRYYRGPISLTEAFHRSMSGDPVAPILAQKHYRALERRLETVIRAIVDCLDKTDDIESVIRAEHHNKDVAVGDEEPMNSEEEPDDTKKEQK